MFPLPELIRRFFRLVATGTVEIYNEFSLQHEVGVFLRSAVSPEYKVQFERPVDYFSLRPAPFVKTEIDISVFRPKTAERYAIEFKFPRNGQYPEQMFKAAQDVAFLEQLVSAGFTGGAFVMAADDPLFYGGRDQSGIYAFFRAGRALHGVITKPTGRKDESVTVQRSYVLSWQAVASQMKYLFVPVGENMRREYRLTTRSLDRIASPDVSPGGGGSGRPRPRRRLDVWIVGHREQAPPLRHRGDARAW